MITRVTEVTREQVADKIGRLHSLGRNEHGSWESLKPKLHTIMTPMVNEGFFSDTVVLVEGGRPWCHSRYRLHARS